jgi:hypothetical protein
MRATAQHYGGKKTIPHRCGSGKDFSLLLIQKHLGSDSNNYNGHQSIQYSQIQSALHEQSQIRE